MLKVHYALIHSVKHRRSAKAPQNIGFSATVFARALIGFGEIDGSSTHDGSRLTIFNQQNYVFGVHVG